MNPTDFPERTRTYVAPPEPPSERLRGIDWCCDLSVHEGHDELGVPVLISCFKPAWRDRLRILFGGPVWLTIVGRGQPPVSLRTDCPFNRRTVLNDGRPA